MKLKSLKKIGFAFDKDYQKLHRRLTIIASGCLFVVIFIYATVINLSQQNARERFEHRVDEFNQSQYLLPPPTTPAPIDQSFIKSNFQQWDRQFQQNLWLMSVSIWLLSSGVAYYFIGRMLLPVQQKTREQEEFIANASHELKTPITTIKTELATIDESHLKTELKNNLTIINDETLTLQNLVAKLLQFNQLAVANQFTTFNLATVITAQQKRYQTSYQQRQLQLTVTQPTQLMLTSDQEKISEIISILLDNAAKYSDQTTSVTVNLTSNNKQVFLTVTNTGCGIKPGDEQKIFNRFYRVTDRRVQQESGSGLGLAIAQKIASQINGQLTLVDGSPAHTTFQLKLKI